MNIIGNLYVSNGMSAGNTASEARVQDYPKCSNAVLKPHYRAVNQPAGHSPGGVKPLSGRG